ncbi:MAG: hypothetical protein AAFX03_09040 [Pseudomonadota bacterium]
MRLTQAKRPYGLLLRTTAASTAALAFAGVAAADGTDAGTSVENTFSLSYSAGGASQPVITNDTDTAIPGADVQGTETLFTVDRLVDHTVTATNSPLAVGAGADPAAVPAPSPLPVLEFTVENTGNDTQSYSLLLVDPAGDVFDATGLTLTYFLDTNANGDPFDDGGAGVAIVQTPTATATTTDVVPDIAEDAVFGVRVTGTIPTESAPSTPLVEGDTDDIVLIAQARDPSEWALQATSPATAGTASAGDITAADTGGNTETGVAENVLADEAGTTSEAANDGLHSDTGTFTIASPGLLAEKDVIVIATEGTLPAFDCAVDAAVTPAYAVPDACIEYEIKVTNTGTLASSVASGITLTDVLPTGVRYVGATFTGFDAAPAPTLTEPALGTVCDGAPAAGTACTVTLSGATLSPVVGATDAEAFLRIRAHVE